ncbi:hypothetical protein A2U01_0081115, partial [Trifolium medium]|nr:hypothetical protein [Trifolium medium]
DCNQLKDAIEELIKRGNLIASISRETTEEATTTEASIKGEGRIPPNSTLAVVTHPEGNSPLEGMNLRPRRRWIQ